MSKRYSSIIKLIKSSLGILVILLLFSILVLPLILKNNDRVNLNRVDNTTIKHEASNEIINPNLHGQDKNGRPYLIKAKSGSKINDNTIKLSGITGKLKIEGEHKYYALSARNGESKQNSDLIQLYGDVVLSNQDGYSAHTEEVAIKYGEASASNNSPIHIEGNGLWLNAQSFEVLPGANTYIFKGNVIVIIE